MYAIFLEKRRISRHFPAKQKKKEIAHVDCFAIANLPSGAERSGFRMASRGRGRLRNEIRTAGRGVTPQSGCLCRNSWFEKSPGGGRTTTGQPGSLRKESYLIYTDKKGTFFILNVTATATSQRSAPTTPLTLSPTSTTDACCTRRSVQHENVYCTV